MKYHFLRMLNHEWEVTRKLFEDDYISIGYSDLNRVENNYDYVSYYNGFGDKKSEILHNDIINIYGKWGHNYKIERFLNLEIGDIVIVPDYKCFYITRVTEKPISFYKIKNKYTDKENIDIGVVCKIEKIKNNSGEVKAGREKFAKGDLKGKLRSFGGYYELKKENIEEIIKNFKEDKIIKIEEELKAKTKNIILKTIVENLNSSNIERFIKKLMEKTGAVCEIPPKNDKSKTENRIGDVDITCVYEKIKHIIYIQVKYHNGFTGDWGIKQLEDYNDNSVAEDYSTSYWLITTGEISDETRKAAMENKNKTIRLIDGLELAEMIMELGIDDLEINE